MSPSRTTRIAACPVDRPIRISCTKSDSLKSWVTGKLISKPEILAFSRLVASPLVEPLTQPDALLQAQAEIRGLRATIVEMRTALERLKEEKLQAVQQATGEAALQSGHLRETISAMRDQLETLQFEKRSAIQQAATNSFNDVQQFTMTVRNLRDEMEKMRESHARELQELRRTTRDEARHLEETIIRLREQLEAHSHGRA
jgi:predicted  nucleic acid-binding Zn-ribbon protein